MIRSLRAAVTWSAVAAALLVPLVVAAGSPLLAWRQPVYILAGFAGILALGLMLVQPLLIGGSLPGLGPARARRGHRWIGAVLVAAVAVHVAGLWITSPPDVIDALTFASPTVFTPFGVVAMWAVFIAAALASWRHRLGRAAWRRAHRGLAAVIVTGSVGHALPIDGTMGTVSKVLLCGLVVLATGAVLFRRRNRPAQAA